MVDIDSDEQVISLFEVDLQKPRNLSVYDSEECEHEEGVCVYYCVTVRFCEVKQQKETAATRRSSPLVLTFF